MSCTFSIATNFLEYLFNEKRFVIGLIFIWTVVSSSFFVYIMLEDESNFLSFGPNEKTKLFGVAIDSWDRWLLVAFYTFISTAVAAFSSDAIVPWITNTVQDHKTREIPYEKWQCLLIIQIFTIYSVIMGVLGLFVALTQVDFMLVRIAADMVINHVTTYYFLNGKRVERPKRPTSEEKIESTGVESSTEMSQLMNN